MTEMTPEQAYEIVYAYAQRVVRRAREEREASEAESAGSDTITTANLSRPVR